MKGSLEDNDQPEIDEERIKQFKKLEHHINYSSSPKWFTTITRIDLSRKINASEYIVSWSIQIPRGVQIIKPEMMDEVIAAVKLQSTLLQKIRDREILYKNEIRSFIGAILTVIIGIILSLLTMKDESYNSESIKSELTKIGAFLTTLLLGFSNLIWVMISTYSFKSRLEIDKETLINLDLETSKTKINWELSELDEIIYTSQDEAEGFHYKKSVKKQQIGENQLPSSLGLLSPSADSISSLNNFSEPGSKKNPDYERKDNLSRLDHLIIPSMIESVGIIKTNIDDTSVDLDEV